MSDWKSSCGKARILCGDANVRLAELPDGSVHLVLTSPPYDALREYGGHSWDFFTIATEISRLLCDGGMLCWNVGAQVVDGSESLAPFKQAIFFVEQCGLRLHDTMLYAKTNGAKPDPTRYNQSFEYVFVLAKGKPRAVNLIRDKPNVTAGRTALGKWTVRQADGTMKEREYRKEAAEFGVRPNIWVGLTRGQEEICQALPHPAMMPQWLARDLIISWSDRGNMVCDPFLGSGTTSIASVALERLSIGVELNPEYCAMAQKRIEHELSQTLLALT